MYACMSIRRVYMIQKYRVGNPIHTDAVIRDIPADAGMFPYFTRQDDGTLIRVLDKKDAVYGLGQNVRGINKRGFCYIRYFRNNLCTITKWMYFPTKS